MAAYTIDVRPRARRSLRQLDPSVRNALAQVIDKAATLLSAAERLMSEQGTAWPPDEAPHFEHSKAEAARALAAADFERAWTLGQN